MFPRIVSAAALIGALLSFSAIAGGDVELVPFTSPAGVERFVKSGAKADFAPLANQFEAQSTIAFCGPTSATIVLNALDPIGARAPLDRGRLHRGDTHHLPPGVELVFRRHTQDSVIATSAKKRSQVLGEPVLFDGKLRRDDGFQLRQLDQMLRAHGVQTQMVVVDADKAEADIRRDLAENLGRSGDFIIVNYLREALGQMGGGHISPLAAYDADTDSVLILDVNPSRYPWVWVPLPQLVKAMRTLDTVENRGYILISPAQH